jgi:glycosyltransferase involved in cell wall biosynthesis
MALKVGIVTGQLAPTDGGGWTFTRSLIDALTEHKTKHQFVFLERNSQDSAETSCGRGGDKRASEYMRLAAQRMVASGRAVVPRAVRQASRFLRAPRPVVDSLRSAIETERPDIVWFLHPDGVPVDVPFIATVWDLEHRKQPYFPEVSTTGWTWSQREATYRRTLPRAAFVLTGTEVGKEEIARFYAVDYKNIKVIAHPTPAVDVTPTEAAITLLLRKLGIERGFLLYPAQFWPHKNHVNLLHAVNLLERDYELRVNLVLTGSDKGNLEYVKETVRELNLTQRVFDLGFVPREVLGALYLSAFALVYPSFFGPENLPPLEAFAAGCPVVSANIPGAKEQLGSAALLFDPADPADIAAKIHFLYQDQDCRTSLVSEGAKIARERTPRAYVESLCQVLDDFGAIRRCWGSGYRGL